MERIVQFVNEKISPPLMKVEENCHMIAVKSGMILAAPPTIIGSTFIILTQPPLTSHRNSTEPHRNISVVPTSVTFGIISLIAVAGISYSLSQSYRINTIRNALMSLICYLLVQSSMGEDGSYSINTGNFGTLGVFSTIIISFVVVEVYQFYMSKQLATKTSGSVSPVVARSLNTLIPLLISLTVFWIIRVPLGFDINAGLNMLFSSLVQSLSTFPGVLVSMLLRSLLWCVGIHGGAVLSVADPTFLVTLGANTGTLAIGEPLSYITAAGLVSSISIDSGDATLILVTFMIFPKDQGLRTLGKLFLLTNILEINESIVFSVPMVLNPVLMIPYTLYNTLLALIAYLLMYFDVIGRPIVAVPWTTPPILMQYSTLGGDWRAAVYGVPALLVNEAIHHSFFKMLEKQRLNITIQEAVENEENLEGETVRESNESVY